MDHSGTATSKLVLKDADLDTCNPKTLYLFNLVRGEILEYEREIVEKKLRALKLAESACISELDAGYKKARRNFQGRGDSIRNITKRVATTSGKEIKHNVDSEFILEDAEVWMDAEEA